MATIGRLAVSIVADIAGLKRGLKGAEREVERYTARVNQKARVGSRGSVGAALGMPGYPQQPQWPAGALKERPQPGMMEQMSDAARRFGVAATAIAGAVSTITALGNRMIEMAQSGNELRRQMERAGNVINQFGTDMARMEMASDRARVAFSERHEEWTKAWRGAMLGIDLALAGRQPGRPLGERQYQLDPMRHERPFGLARATSAAGFRAIQQAQMDHYVRRQKLQRLQDWEDQRSEQAWVMLQMSQGQEVEPGMAYRAIRGQLSTEPGFDPNATPAGSTEDNFRRLTETIVAAFKEAVVLLGVDTRKTIEDYENQGPWLVK